MNSTDPSALTRPCRFAFEDFEIDAECWELRKDGQLVSVQPKALELVFHLIRHRHRVVTHAELFAAIWPDARVSESSLTFAVRVARLALGDSGVSQRVIRNVRTRGYRFVAEVAAPSRRIR